MNISACRRALFPLLLAFVGPAALAAPAANGEVIVKFKAGAALTRQHALAAQTDAAGVRSVLVNRASALGARHGRALEAGHAVSEQMQVVRAAGMSAAELARELAADPDVEFAVPNERMRRAADPKSEPLYLSGPTADDVTQRGGPVVGQWYLRAPSGQVLSSINVEPAWSRSTGAGTVVVAVLDTGVRREHPDFAGQTFLGYDFASDATYSGDGDDWDADPSDPGDGVSSAEAATTPFSSINCAAENSSWHGTATSSLIGAAANGVGMAGVAPGIQLLHVRVLSKCGGSLADITAGMRWAAGLAVPGVPLNTHPAKVLNMSLGGDAATCSSAYQSAVDDVMATGSVIVVSAGNDKGTALVSLATCNGVIPVTAVRHSGTKVGFSSLGPQAAIAAPGGNCVNDTGACLYPLIAASNTGTRGPVSSSWFDSYIYEVGTSFSAPLVAGTVALMFSVQPALTPAQARTALTSTARPFPTRPTGSTVPQCQAPNATQQIECYCTTTTCGAGMLDAGAAVAAAATATPGPTARITYTPAAPTAGSTITFDSSTSTPTSGSTITSYEWTLVNGGGIISGLINGGTIATSRTATLTPTGAGTFTVSLLVTDGLANSGLVNQTITVAAAPVPTGGLGGGTSSGGGGGGGALSLPWLLLLALAVLALFRTRSRRA